MLQKIQSQFLALPIFPFCFCLSNNKMSIRSCKSCGISLKRNIVAKDGPNKGDAFWSCPNNQANELCSKSFDWEDKQKHPDKFPQKSGGGGYRSSASSAASSGAVGAGFLTEATGQELLAEMRAFKAALQQANPVVDGGFEPMQK